MTTELKELDPADWEQWYRCLNTAFAGEVELGEQRALWRSLTEHKRSLGAWDDGQVVGTLSAFSFRMAVPGGAVVPTAGLTMVGVLPTHRRRGLLTTMIRRHLEQVREAGEPLAALTASEAAIYGRFGYGAATGRIRADIDTRRVRLAEPAAPGADGVRLRLVDSVAALPETEKVYARQVERRPGMLERLPGWERLETVVGGVGAGSVGQLCVVAERDGAAVGYARYGVSEADGTGTVRVRSLAADDGATELALWRFLFSIDLTSRVSFYDRPVDDAWQYEVDDIRGCAVQLRDNLYLRPVELGAALAARRYAAPVDVVLEVTDPFCPWNEGRWRLSGDRDGAVCERTTDAADLALSVREVGAAYLGGTSLTGLARAGRVRELRAGALARATTAFGWDVAPWLPHGF
ncbi:GNAT family N-acetyltransferase [Streptomyces spiramenti]|uniref:GNAT family N-acetyltransferase n=1 Tax=Streptomyces spiramenti TaxID=2720606 RepID=A0ABX1ASL9_9ACTN|nr:GNAT family N-acetyltransferase [Streptomyces spiramenti]NJP68794.1 GNAT family N-acetyltransferase [Streptomyces spiramenti]